MLNRSQQGLTLLEVVIGIALVVTLATLFSPDFLFVGRARIEPLKTSEGLAVLP